LEWARIFWVAVEPGPHRMKRDAKQASATSAATRKLRCAVYTRKSSEEGLDMEFNSLDAE